MEDYRKDQTMVSALANPGHRLAAYFHTRAHLANHESDFHCDPACTRPGCKNKDILVPVSLVDLMGAAQQQHESVGAIYQRHYTLGLLPTEHNDWIKKVSLRLNKPCPFLEQDRCAIYPVRPLACIIFPEYLVMDGRFESEAGKEPFRDFLCLQSPLRLSPERAEVVGRLKKMWEREMPISHYYLFDHGSCYIDCSTLTKELEQADKTLIESEAMEIWEPPGTIAHQVMEQIFRERSAGCPTFDGVKAKMNRLEDQEGQAEFLQFLHDERLIKKLMRRVDDRDLIFRIGKGRLQASRRSLLPREYSFF
jgi:Fe-S-cluster containining protein